MVERGGKLQEFEQLSGPVDKVQADWHAYMLKLKDGLSGKDLDFLKPHRAVGEVPVLRPPLRSIAEQQRD